MYASGGHRDFNEKLDNPEYCHYRGWDQSGIPKKEKLKNLRGKTKRQGGPNK